MTQRTLSYLGSIALFLCVLGGCNNGGGALRVQVSYHEASAHLRASVTRDLATGETLHLRVRQGEITDLDCASQYGSIERIDGNRVSDPFPGPTFEGPQVDASLFDSPYDMSWLDMPEPTAEMLAAIADGGYVIDVCLMNGPTVVLQDSMDILEALDVLGPNGKYDGEPEEQIRSTAAYADACVAEMGEIPFFTKLADGDYSTYNCLDSVPIPTTVTSDTGTEFPQTGVSVCDNPQYIYSLCEPNAVSGMSNGPRVASRSNEQGTHWVLLCRKARTEEGAYNDIAMVGHNPYTGHTCFFQNALYSRTDGLHVPHPGDHIESEASPQESASLWEGIHGGLGSGIQCARCHDADPFIHTPWIDGALDQNGDPVVPKMGVNQDFTLGFNESPYTILNTEGQGWTMPQHLTSPEAAACTQCHRIGNGEWASSWINRMDGTDSSWTGITTPAYHEFEHVFWMPPDLDGLDATTFPDSDYGRAMAFIKMCGQGGSAGCQWEALPSAQLTDPGEPPPIDLEGFDLALASAKILGANAMDLGDARCTGADGSCATRRCAECHSTSRQGMRHWLDITEQAWGTCQLDRNPDELTQEEAMRTIDCMRVDSADNHSVFAADRIGIMAAGAQYNYFRKLFRQAYGEGAWLNEYLRFRARVGMPKGSHPRLTQIEYATVLKWFQDRLPNLEEVIQEAPPPDTCTDLTTPALASLISTMQLEGWEATNRDAGIRMFGCAGADPLTCFSSNPDRTAAWGNGTGTIREVTHLGFRTSFWTRSSADGRFIGNGGGEHGATITDLQRGIDIGVDASYDPGFFPDNSGFIFQGGGAGICAQSLLETDTLVTFDEPECIMASGINLYQHVARGLNGGDYFIINSQFTSDSGGSNEDPTANFGDTSTMKFSPMVFDGSRYQQLPAVIVESPYEGDSVMSPSGSMVISRIAGPDGHSLGYSLRRVAATRAGDNYRINIDEQLGRFCLPGAKANISFDERFFATHHYEDGGSNIYVTDLSTGMTTKVTNFSDGTEARYPHFRSDGWLYFLVVEGGGSGAEYIAASDVALVLRSR